MLPQQSSKSSDYMMVILDPGHNGKVAGKRSPDGRLREYRWAREVCRIIENQLDSLGIRHQRTTYIREDEGPEIGLLKRCIRANEIAKNNPKEKIIFLSIHVNADRGEGWTNSNGWSVFVSPRASSESKKLASLTANHARQEGLRVRTQETGKLYWKANLTVLGKTSMPAILVENLFMTNKKEVEFLLSDNGKQTLANIMVKGICDYFEIIYE